MRIRKIKARSAYWINAPTVYWYHPKSILPIAYTTSESNLVIYV